MLSLSKDCSRHEPSDLFDFILLLLLLLLGACFSSVGLHTSVSEGSYFLQLNYEEVFSPVILSGAYVLFLAFALTLFFDRPGVKVNPLFLLLFTVFVVLRFLSAFAYPYASYEQEIVFRGESYLLNASAPSFTTRLFNYLNDSFLGLDVLIFFTYVPSFKKEFLTKAMTVMDILFFIFLGVAILYSFIKEAPMWQSNLTSLFQDGKIDGGIRSFFDHKNVFGLFLLLGSGIAYGELFRTGHIVYIFLPFIFLFLSYLIFSRTPFWLILFSYVLVVIFFLVFKRKSYPVTARVLLIVCLALVFFAILYGIFYWEEAKAFFKQMTQQNTLISRNELSAIALTLFSPFVFFFGYGKTVYRSLLEDLLILTGTPTDAITAHNGYLDMLMEWGAFVLLLVVAIYFFVAALEIRRLSKKDTSRLGYFVLFLLLILYSFLEPRGLFQNEPSSAVYTIYAVIPILSGAIGEMNRFNRLAEKTFSAKGKKTKEANA